MYLYIYDSFLNDKKHSGLLAKIETRLTDLGIGGKIFRLSPLRNMTELLHEEVKNGAKTVIVVGNDKTFAQIINFAAQFDITLGLIPVGPDNKIAKTLGIPNHNEACNIISARKIETVDLGRANNTYFLSEISVEKGDVTIEYENKYAITPNLEDQVTIYNLKPIFAASWGHEKIFNPKDGILEVLIQPLKKGFLNSLKNDISSNSLIPFKKIFIKSKNSLPVYTDGQKVLKTPVKVEIIPNKLKIIVGKDRLF